MGVGRPVSAADPAAAAATAHAAAAPERSKGALRTALDDFVVAPLVMSSFVGSILLSSVLLQLAAALLFWAPGHPATWTAVAVLVRAGGFRMRACTLGMIVCMPLCSCGNPLVQRGLPTALLCPAQAALVLTPLGPPPAWAAAYISYACRLAAGYFSAELVFEDEQSIKADRPYVIGGRGPSTCISRMRFRQRCLIGSGSKASSLIWCCSGGCFDAVSIRTRMHTHTHPQASSRTLRCPPPSLSPLAPAPSCFPTPCGAARTG
jgi:hypothetical protein